MMLHLKQARIGTGIHYPIPLHLQKAYISLSYHQGDFPVSEGAAPEILSLPMFPNMTSEQQERVIQESLRFLGDPILLAPEGKAHSCVE